MREIRTSGSKRGQRVATFKPSPSVLLYPPRISTRPEMGFSAFCRQTANSPAARARIKVQIHLVKRKIHAYKVTYRNVKISIQP